MASPTVAEITASRGAATGALSGAPLGTALPTDAITVLGVGYVGYGYIGGGGIIPTRAVSVNETRDMNGVIVFVAQSEFSRTYQAELLQGTNVDIKKLIFGTANVTVTAATATVGALIAVVDLGLQAAHQVLVATTFSGTKTHREVAADAQITTVEIGPLVGTNIRAYTVTWMVFPDSGGAFVREFDDDGVFSA